MVFVSIRVHWWFAFIDDWVFHPRMIRPAGRGRCLTETKEKVGIHEDPREKRPPGARASRPHPLRWVAAQFPRDVAPGHPAGGNRLGSAEAESWRRCRSSRVGERGEAVPVLCGRDARAPGLHPVTSSQPSRSIGLRVHSWFTFNNRRQFLPPMIHPPGRGRAIHEGTRRGTSNHEWTRMNTNPVNPVHRC